MSSGLFSFHCVITLLYSPLQGEIHMSDDAIHDILEQTESDPAFQALFDLFDCSKYFALILHFHFSSCTSKLMNIFVTMFWIHR